MVAYEVVRDEVPQSYVKAQLRTLGDAGWTMGQHLAVCLSANPGAGRSALGQTLNEEPHPHEPVTFGFPNLKPAPWVPST